MEREATDTEQGSQTRGVKRVKDQLPGEGQYANLQRQTQLYATVVPCSLVALRAQNMVEESRKRSKTAQTAGEIYSVFLQRLTSAVHRTVADTDVRKVLSESLAFENATTECQRP